ncbi:MAG: hypothetical protein ACYSU2_07025, partial [Planctomycetota bacterium]
MRIGDLTYWLAWLLGPVLICLGVALTWWGLFGDRARGRRRCPRCWHDLSHTPGMTCSECGYTAKRERTLFRTRRRLIPAVVGVAVASLATTWGIEQLQREGIVSQLPTRVLLLSLPFVGGAHEGITSELSLRLSRAALTDSHYRTLIKRCLRGDRGARPVTARWEEKYGSLLDQCRNGAPEDIDLDAALLALPARIQLGTDRPWPADAPVCLNLEVHHWWTPGTACRVHVTPKWDGAETVTIVGSGVRRSPRPYPLVIERPGDARTLDFDLALERRLPVAEAAWEHVQEQSISVALTLDGPLADVLQPEESDELREAVVSTFGQGVVKWTGGRSPVRVRFDPRHTYVLGLEDTAIGASVEILRDGDLARRLDLWWPSRPELGNDNYGWLVAYEDVPMVMEANEGDGRWQMRVRGDPAIALRAGAAS